VLFRSPSSCAPNCCNSPGRSFAVDQGFRLHRDGRVAFHLPAAEGVPVVAPDLAGVLGTIGAVAAGKGLGRTVAVAAPADALGVGGLEGKFLGHGTPRRGPCSASGCRSALTERHPEAEHGPLRGRSEEHTSELQSRENLVCRLLLEEKERSAAAR